MGSGDNTARLWTPRPAVLPAPDLRIPHTKPPVLRPMSGDDFLFIRLFHFGAERGKARARATSDNVEQFGYSFVRPTGATIPNSAR